MLTLPLPRTIAELPDSWDRVEWQDRASRSSTEVWSRRAGFACLGILWLVTFRLLWITRDVVAAAESCSGSDAMRIYDGRRHELTVRA